VANLATWLLGLVTPLAKQVLVSLGFGIVTYTGVDAGLNTIIADIQAQLSSGRSDLLVYAQLSGVFEAMGIILGAIAFSITLSSMSKLTRL